MCSLMAMYVLSSFPMSIESSYLPYGVGAFTISILDKKE